MTIVRLIITNIVLLLVIAPDKSAASDCDFQPARYSPSEICGSVHLFGGNMTFADYSQCRVLNGSLTIREFDLALLPAFQRLEIVLDFVVFREIFSSSPNATLARLLPRLRAVLGRYEILNYSLFVIHYGLQDNMQLPSLRQVCGNIKIEFSSGLCFPHSQTYWNLIAQQDGLFPFSVDTPRIETAEVYEPLEAAKFYGAVDLPVLNAGPLKPFVGPDLIQQVRFVMYEIDRQMFEFYVNIPWHDADQRQDYFEQHVRNSTCYEIGFQRNFALGNLRNIEHVDFIEDQTYASLLLPPWSANRTGDLERLRRVRQRFPANRTNFLENNYDILRINITNLPFTGFGHYRLRGPFQYDAYYLFKVMLCENNLIYMCTIQRVFLFHPTRAKVLSLPVAAAAANTPLAARTPPPPGSAPATDSSLASLLALLLVPLCLALLLYASLKVRSSRQKLRKNIVSFNPEYTPLANLHCESDMRSRKCCEIDKNRLVLNADNLLGKGQFGYVYEGVLNDYTLGSHCVIPGNEEHCDHEFQATSAGSFGAVPLRVAIKQLKSNVNDTERERFLLEANIMRNFDSNFLVKLIGVCSIQEPVMVVMEFMQSGDLKRFLVKCQHDYKKFRAAESVPSRLQMLEWAVQIADGMFYLHSKQVIHRDLATRNCMLTKELQIKIGDFGLTRHVFGGDYYRLSTQVSMPLRWMAPESLQRMIFTPKTDVWSYGVVLWEIMSLGKQPYKGIPDALVKELIGGYTKLQTPPFSTAFLWDLAKFCWSKSPSHRPSFETIVKILLPRLSPEAKSRFVSLSFLHKVCALEDNQESVDSRTNRLFSRAWDKFYQNFFSRPDASDGQKSGVRPDRSSYASTIIRSNSNSSASSSEGVITADGQESTRKISYDSVYSSATQDYSSDSK